MSKNDSLPSRRYPVLATCLTQGRGPTIEEIERLAARIGRELGRDRTVWREEKEDGSARRRLMAAARTAVLGETYRGRIGPIDELHGH